MLHLKKISKNKLEFKTKYWITSGIQKSISIKSRLLKKLINKNDPQRKSEFHDCILKYTEVSFLH